jgi:hypothetical protein
MDFRTGDHLLVCRTAKPPEDIEPPAPGANSTRILFIVKHRFAACLASAARETMPSAKVYVRDFRRSHWTQRPFERTAAHSNAYSISICLHMRTYMLAWRMPLERQTPRPEGLSVAHCLHAAMFNSSLRALARSNANVRFLLSLCFHNHTNSFLRSLRSSAQGRKPTPLLSCSCALFAKNTREGVPLPPPKNPPSRSLWCEDAPGPIIPRIVH